MSTEDYKRGELVWSKLRGHPWWPSMVVSNVEICRVEPGPNHRWVKWLGETRHSKVAKKSMRPLHMFCEYFCDARYLGDEGYRRALYEALGIAAYRAKVVFCLAESINDIDAVGEEGEGEENLQPDKEIGSSSAQNGMQKSKDQECRDMIEWAKKGFLPNGPSSLQPITDIEEHFSKEDSLICNGRVEYRGKMLDKVRKGKEQLKDLCVGCCVNNVDVEHPLVHGGLCSDCKMVFKKSTFVYEMDGYQTFCSVCSEDTQLVICGNRNCSRSFCTACLDNFDGPGTSAKAREANSWLCYMCRPVCTGLLQRREDWPTRLFDIFASDRKFKQYSTPQLYIPIPANQRKPIRVLSLFDGIGNGKVALEQLGLQVEIYCASEIDEVAITMARIELNDIRHVGDIRYITDKNLDKWGPFDLLLGGSPSSDLSLANPNRRGVYHPRGTGVLFFHYCRILRTLQEKSNGRRFFWLFENVRNMDEKDKTVICRFLKGDPLTVGAYGLTAADSARYCWGNLPAMDRPRIASASRSPKQDGCLTGLAGNARNTKIQTAATASNLPQQGGASLLPESMQDSSNGILPREMEKDFGLPTQHAECSNFGTTRRQQLLRKAWRACVIKHLLSPLKEYFASDED